MDKRILWFGYGLPIVVILISIIRPAYYYIMYPQIVEAIVVGTKEVMVDNPEYKMTDLVAEYEYSFNGKKYRQTFGNHVSNPDKINGQKKQLRVNKKDPLKLYYKNVIRPLDIIMFIGAVLFMIAFSAAKKMI